MKTNFTGIPNRRLIGCVAMTIVVGCGMFATIVLVSGALKAIEQINRVDDTLADLSHYIADGHASIRARMATLGSVDDAIVRFDSGVARRMARFESLNTLLGQQTGTFVWAQPLRETAGVHDVEVERRAYVTAAAVTAMTSVNDPAMSLRLFDQHAQKLIQTVEAVRDSAEVARSRALVAADALVALSSGIGALLILCLIWHPMFRRAGGSHGIGHGMRQAMS